MNNEIKQWEAEELNFEELQQLSDMTLSACGIGCGGHTDDPK